MKSSKRTLRRVGAFGLAIATFAPVMLIASPANAFPKNDPVYTFNYNVTATTTVKKANLTLSPPPGKFNGGIDLSTGQLVGQIAIPNTTFTQDEAGIGVVTATAAMVQLKKVTGHVDISNFKVTATSVFNIRILKMYLATPTLPTLPFLPPIQIPQVNLVGNGCGTSSPITVTMSGKANLSGASKFSGTFSIPNFANCGVMTTVLNEEIPGPGNSFSAVATAAS